MNYEHVVDYDEFERNCPSAFLEHIFGRCFYATVAMVSSVSFSLFTSQCKTYQNKKIILLPKMHISLYKRN